MPLRCLLFSSDEGLVQPIWQALSDLGIEGEYCQSAVDAVERVTTQLFQIVITDWDDQPEAAFLLKTARDLKATNRPLTLAIVNDGAGLPEALKAGANSVLLKPIRTEQVRDTMKTACELLRAKIPASVKPMAPVTSPGKPEQNIMAAAAAAGAGSHRSQAKRTPKISFRAGEFLQSASSTPGAQFDTEAEVQMERDQVPVEEMDALTELEPMAAVVQTAAAVLGTGPEPAQPQGALTGWAALQARLGKTEPQPVNEVPPQNQILSYKETSSDKEAATLPAENGDLAKEDAQEQAQSEGVLFDYMAGKPPEPARPEENHPRRRRVMLLVACGAIVLTTIAIPQTRQIWDASFQIAVRAGGKWLNPPPTRVAQIPVQHDSFANTGDEYQMPAAGNVPNAATDSSQIHVLPVVDPTAKPEKVGEPSNGAAQSTVENSADQNSSEQSASVQGHTEGQIQDSNSSGDHGERQNAAAMPAASASSSVPENTNSGATRFVPSTASAAPATRSYWKSTVVSGGSGTGIPSSLRSQLASMTPESSGSKPVEAAMSSIEPVKLPEATSRELIVQSVDPGYPATAKASGQRGSVILQVLIGRDGVVQDAKFLQGSLVFAQAAIGAVRQWRFKPYSMNGRAVSVQSTITLNFKPSA